jgi:parafibromin
MSENQTENALESLRDSIRENKRICMVDANGNDVADLSLAKSLNINGHMFSLNMETSYIQSTLDNGNRKFYTLDSVYYFYIHNNLPHAEYFQACTSTGIKPITFMHKKDLLDYLRGGNSVNVLAPNGITGVKNESVTLDESKANTKILRDKERVLEDRNSITSVNFNKTFMTTKNMAVSALNKGKRKENSIPTAQSISSSDVQQTKKSKEMATSQKNLSSKTPFYIIVPHSLTSLITLYNVQDFLKNSEFQSSESMRDKNPVRESTITFERTNPLNGTSYLFNVIDSVDRFKDNPSEWERVVGVFVSGQKWQFRGWKWEEPVDIFSQGIYNVFLIVVKGFYLKFNDSNIDNAVKNWNVTVLEVNRYKRHFDGQCVHKFWGILDQWMLRKV